MTDEFKHFLAMGGYAFYVWATYGLLLLLLFVHVLLPWQWLRRLKKMLKQPDVNKPSYKLEE